MNSLTRFNIEAAKMIRTMQLSDKKAVSTLERPQEVGSGVARVAHAICGCQTEVSPKTALCGHVLGVGNELAPSGAPKCIVCIEMMRKPCRKCFGTGKAA